MDSLIQNGFAGLARIDLIGGATPLHRASSLERALEREGIEAGIYLKRDDVMPIGGGGNKIRKLQYLIPQVLEGGNDTVITFGGVQSNHARLTAAVCAKLGLECHLVLSQQVDIPSTDYQANGNPWLNKILGAHTHLLEDPKAAPGYAQALMERLEQQGKQVAVIPPGGSTALGAVGYAECATEIAQQAVDMGLNFKCIAVANGSSGTQAGLIAGWVSQGGAPDVIQGYAVLADADQTKNKTVDLTRATLALAGYKNSINATEINVDGCQRGAAYGQPTEAMIEAVSLLARTEGILLDPVYSGKAFAGLLALLRQGGYRKGDNVVFVMTGGVPGLYAYQSTLENSFA